MPTTSQRPANLWQTAAKSRALRTYFCVIVGYSSVAKSEEGTMVLQFLQPSTSLSRAWVEMSQNGCISLDGAWGWLMWSKEPVRDLGSRCPTVWVHETALSVHLLPVPRTHTTRYRSFYTSWTDPLSTKIKINRSSLIINILSVAKTPHVISWYYCF